MENVTLGTGKFKLYGLRELQCAYQRGRDVCWDSSVWAIIAANVVFCPARESWASECAIERYPMWQPKYHWQKEHASLESIIISQCNMWWFWYYVSLICAPRLNKGATASRVSILYDAESLNLITFECCNTETYSKLTQSLLCVKPNTPRTEVAWLCSAGTKPSAQPSLPRV